MRLFVLFFILILVIGWFGILIFNNLVYMFMDMCYLVLFVIEFGFMFFQFWDVFVGFVFCLVNLVKLYYYFEILFYVGGLILVFSIVYLGIFDYVYYGLFNFLLDVQVVVLFLLLVISSGILSFGYMVSMLLVVNKVYMLLVKFYVCFGIFIIICGFWKCSCLGSQFLECDDCLFLFILGVKLFVVLVWVSEGEYLNMKIIFVDLVFWIIDNFILIIYLFYLLGQVIDGWQWIEGIFMGFLNGDMMLIFVGGSSDMYFDDVWIFFNDGSMMSYVYDVVIMWLVVELDEWNYVKFYEYDEEGKLVCVKKEMEQGVMIIQENCENFFLKLSEL